MITEATIQSAIADVRAEPEALEEIATEYGIKPEVLRARVEKAFGSIDAMKQRDVTDRALAERAEQDRAAKVADGIARLESMFVGGRDHPGKGTEFMFDGERYVFVLLSLSHPTYYARCVRHSDGHIVGFNRPAYNRTIAPAIAARTSKKAA